MFHVLVYWNNTKGMACLNIKGFFPSRTSYTCAVTKVRMFAHDELQKWRNTNCREAVPCAARASDLTWRRSVNKLTRRTDICTSHQMPESLECNGKGWFPSCKFLHECMIYNLKYRYAPNNDVSVNEGRHIWRRSHKIIILKYNKI